MTAITLKDFADFFEALYEHPPYDWQLRLAERAAKGDWPTAIDLPTGSGKTACLDIAVFGLACQAALPPAQRTAPRRIFFTVNRRGIVDEAYERSERIAEKVFDAEEKGDNGVLGRLAAALRTISGNQRGDAPPLDVLQLRGGAYRDNRWARSATQPTIICTTVDQLGSRLLFRGYGVSSGAAPIQAALVAYDSLVLLDEAHISRPLLQTLRAVRGYLEPGKWAERELSVPRLRVAPMTATPPQGGEDVLRLSDADRVNQRLESRLSARKLAKLEEPIGKLPTEIKRLVTETLEAKPAAIVVFVNRVAAAKEIYELLHKELNKSSVQKKLAAHTRIELIVGSMRPIDREKQAERLARPIGADRDEVSSESTIVVTTQCLEVGADYDFDVLISECASLDALRQRFGRLNRKGRPIEATAYLLIEKKAAKDSSKLNDDKPDDPIYGNALAKTWNWLSERATDGVLDFGIDAFDKLLSQEGEKAQLPPELLPPSAHLSAPVMLPAYVDFWRQTSPRPSPDPDIALFLHGPDSGQEDVRVCWRADLGGEKGVKPGSWIDALALVPPTSAECLSAPIRRVRQWLAGANLTKEDGSGDSLEASADEQGELRQQPETIPRGLLWRGVKDSSLLLQPGDLRPGDTLVLPASAGGWNELGHVPDADATTIDIAERAFLLANDRAVLRLHPSLVLQQDEERTTAADANIRHELLEVFHDREQSGTTASEWQERLEELRIKISQEGPLAESLTLLATAKGAVRIDPYPDEQGIVLRSTKRIGNANWFLPALDDGEDSSSGGVAAPVLLEDHTRHVVQRLDTTLASLPLDDAESALRTAAELHDLGKADPRFQALLRQAPLVDACLTPAGYEAPPLWAKSPRMPATRRQAKAAGRRAELPDGFRHEMLSLQIAERMLDFHAEEMARDLVLHLIASHHGYASPFAPVVIDDDPPEVTINEVRLWPEDRLARPPHRLDSGVVDRFWRLVRRYGWWGLAYLESILRLADQGASAAEAAGDYRHEQSGPQQGEEVNA